MTVIKNASWQISLYFPSLHFGFSYGKGLQSFGSSCFWAFHCFAMDSKELSSILDCFGDQKAIKTQKLNTIWLELIARVLNMTIELKGNNYYSKVFKRVNYRLSNGTFWVVIRRHIRYQSYFGGSRLLMSSWMKAPWLNTTTMCMV